MQPTPSVLKPKTSLNYDLLAIDLDGTLFDARGRVGRANAEAVAAARAAGLRVVVASGRGLVESRHAIDVIGDADPVVVGGGSIVADPRAGSTLHRFPMRPALVRAVAELLDRQGLCALVLKDAAAAGYDYLVVTGERQHPLDPVSQWWFEELGVQVRFVRTLAEDEHPEHTIRIGACARQAVAGPLEAALREAFGGSAMVMHFPAVAAPEHVRDWGPEGPAAVLEVFDAKVTKWTALEWLCAHLGIDPARTAAIGDGLNDVDMLRHAGLGIAMGGSDEAVRSAADVETGANAEDGVAQAIGRILRGEW
ncbi:MAG: HAD family phosphatase [Phycisphaerales bacterium]|nr:MAG: HAD family phosphatase [Phycisphaerales bacterium]